MLKSLTLSEESKLGMVRMVGSCEVGRPSATLTICVRVVIGQSKKGQRPNSGPRTSKETSHDWSSPLATQKKVGKLSLSCSHAQLGEQSSWVSTECAPEVEGKYGLVEVC